MKKTLLLAALSAAVLVAGCEPASTNTSNSNAANSTNSNANTNAAKPMAAAPTTDALLAMDKEANDAYVKKNGQFFEGFLNDKFLILENGGGASDRAATVKMITEDKCQIKDDFTLDKPQMKMIGTDVALLVYHGHFDGQCPDATGKMVTIPPDVEASSVYVKKGDKWLAAFHSETNIVDPKSPPPAAPAPANKKTDKSTAANKPAGNSNSGAAANSNSSSAKPAADPMTDALFAVEKSGWDAWKAGDTQKLKDLSSPDLSIIDPVGTYQATQADTIKSWTEPKCDVKSVNLSDPKAFSLTPDVAILAFKADAVGTCGPQKLGTLWQGNVYQKVGDTWKLVFSASVPPM